VDKEQRDAFYGPGARYSEHKGGEVIRFRVGTEIKQGKILHVRAPGQAIVGGREHPLLYIVDTGKGMPTPVSPSQIVEGSFPVILASYGFKEHSLNSREEAENLAENVVGQLIDNESDDVPKRLRVLSARLEDIGEGRGRVVATCEVVQEEQGES
jgi:hypothetical protein